MNTPCARPDICDAATFARIILKAEGLVNVRITLQADHFRFGGSLLEFPQRRCWLRGCQLGEERDDGHENFSLLEAVEVALTMEEEGIQFYALAEKKLIGISFPALSQTSRLRVLTFWRQSIFEKIRRWPGFVPQREVLEDGAHDVPLLDEHDDPHRPTAVRAHNSAMKRRPNGKNVEVALQLLQLSRALKSARKKATRKG